MRQVVRNVHFHGRLDRIRGRPALLTITSLLVGLAACAAFMIAPARGSDDPPSGGAGEASSGPYRLHSDIAYRRAGVQRRQNLLDVYEPRRATGTASAPVIVWIHGGGWFQGNKVADIAAKANAFTRAGFVFVSINYALSPNHGELGFMKPGRVMYPSYPRDAAAAIGWVRRNIRRFGGDPRRLVLMGHSAGGQIASQLATQPGFLRSRHVNPEIIRGVISLDSVGLDVRSLADPTVMRMSMRQREMYWNAFGSPLDPDSSDRWFRASALEHADRGDSPFLLVVSAQARWRVAEAAEMARRLGQQRRFAVMPVDLDHRQINESFGTDADRLGESRRALRFARTVVGPRRAPEPVVRAPRRRFTIGGRARARWVTLKVGSRPSRAHLRCRLDRRRIRACGGRMNYRVGPGTHTLAAVAFDPTGRRGKGERYRFRVEPQRG